MKLVVISWHSYYNLFNQVAKQIKDFEVKVYSARNLDQKPETWKDVLLEITNCDILLTYRSQNESFWEALEKSLLTKSNKRTKIVYLSYDPSFWIHSNVSYEILAKAYEYIMRSGRENIFNLYNFLAKELHGLDVKYQDPIKTPWEGLYHPDAPDFFSDIEEYLKWYPKKEGPTVGILFPRHSIMINNLELEDLLIREFESRGFRVIPMFAYSVRDEAFGIKGIGEIIEEWLINEDGKPRVDILIKLIFFFLRSSKGKPLDKKEVAEEGVELLKRMKIPVVSPVVSYYKTLEEWEKEELNLDIGWSIALPEFEGVIEPIIVAAQREERDGERYKEPIKSRIQKLVNRVVRWVTLMKTPPEERRIVFILHNNPCASVEATVGSGAHLDTLESVAQIMKRMKESGYTVEPPESGKALIDDIMNRKAISEFRWTTVEEIVKRGGALRLLPVETYLSWFDELPEKVKDRIISAWGRPPGEEVNSIPPAMVYENKIVITGVCYGNVLVCVQPKRGCAGARCDGQVCKILHDPDVPPPHQYIATYLWLSREWKANAIVHVGTHGNLEFLPGKGVGLSDSCFPDICIDTIPHLYIYNADNPPEGTVAKRRAYAVLVDHMQNVLTESGLYGELEKLERLLGEHYLTKDKARRHVLEHEIIELVKKTNLDRGVKFFVEGKRRSLAELTVKEIHEIDFEELSEAIHSHLSLIRNSQIQDGMHVFGTIPEGDRRVDYIYAILRYDAGKRVSLRKKLAQMLGYDLSVLLSNREHIDKNLGRSYSAILEDIDKLGKAVVAEILKKRSVIEKPKERR
ncbi:MAG: cobaltochelatase subunit CobN [Caldimicrobium sp.]|nr:cobaltochelatase subunit CobN [Caldimicrobium sp.]MCX7613557.1 cobaltochelatase subunit CobN [Caldimicrobium sp.]MDW8182259.1 cobaltochelatase subunit CobN [Caldimicrobium sp.]